MRRPCGWLLLGLALLVCPSPSLAKTAQQAHSDAILWLERNQNGDGSWGSGALRPVVTSEALLALAEANRNSTAARRAIAWLRAQDLTAVDHQARRTRAMVAASVTTSSEAQALNGLDSGGPGWGPVGGDGVTSYDTALALGALQAAGALPADWISKRDDVIARRRGDNGWSGDGVPSAGAVSDRTVTAEIVRAMADVASAAQLAPSLSYLGGSATSATPTLEVAARLAALHAEGQTNAALETELLQNVRFSGGAWGTDPFANAIGLLALTTKPGASFTNPAEDADADGDGIRDADDPDRDGDGILNPDDAFPDDPTEAGDLDGDSIGDGSDPDIDGDGVLNGSDAFPFDATESVDTDFDGLGDNVDLDDDNDGVPDTSDDFPLDPTRWSRAEIAKKLIPVILALLTPVCSDGVDNDADGLVDFPDDPGCDSADAEDERTQCQDGVDNDADGQTDYPDDPGCGSANGADELTECQDGVDNDGDGWIDMADPNCAGFNDDRELRRRCGLGFELLLAVPLFGWLYRFRRKRQEDLA